MSSRDSHEPEEPPIRFTNNRKIDREQQRADGGATTPPPAAAAGADGDPDADVSATDLTTEEEEVPMVEAALLDERTADLQRLQAEYANYRKRAERERSAAGDVAVARTLAALLPVIDDVDRARAHGDVTGPFEAIIEKFDRQLATLGLEPFGETGDPFDPTKHEAVAHDERDDVELPTCTTIMRKGYIYKDRLIRPAMVGVSDPVHAIEEPVGEPENEVRDGAPSTEEVHVDT